MSTTQADIVAQAYTPRPQPRHQASVQIGGADFRFCAAHTGLHDGEFEPLHGHTYVPTLTLSGVTDDAGMVVDFRTVKDALRSAIAPLRSRTLVAADANGVVAVRDRSAVHMTAGAKRYVLPAADVVMLPVANTTTEEIAAYLLAELTPILTKARVHRAELALSESPGTAATVTAILRDHHS